MTVIAVIILFLAMMIIFHPDSNEEAVLLNPSSKVEEATEGKHTLFIASPGFIGSIKGLTIFFDDSTVVNNRIKVVLDDKVYWIRLEGR